MNTLKHSYLHLVGVGVLFSTVLRVQFNESVYIVDEGSTVMVCVDIVGANTIIDDDVRLFFSVTSGDGTTTGEKLIVHIYVPIVCMHDLSYFLYDY